jgi:hypothetical protein
MVEQNVQVSDGAQSIATILESALPDEAHDWLLTTAEVAQGYGVAESTIRGHKSTKPEEFLSDRHWVKLENGKVMWTKLGVIRLGFCIESTRGVEFRTKAEGWVLSAMTQADAASLDIDDEYDSLGRAIAQAIAPEINKRRLMASVRQHLPTALDTGLEQAGAALGKALEAQYGCSLISQIASAIAQHQEAKATALRASR